MGRKTITVRQQTFDDLAAGKRDGESWDAYLRRLCDDRDDEIDEEALADAIYRRLCDDLDALGGRIADRVLDGLRNGHGGY